MTILIISRGIPSQKDPLWGNFEFDQAKALAALGHTVIIASVDIRFRLQWRKIGLTCQDINGIHTYNLFVCPRAIIGLFGNRAKEKYTAWLWHRMEKTILAKEGKIDIIYPHYLSGSHKAVNYLKGIHAPIVAIEHWSELNREPMNPAIEKMAKTTYPYVDKLLTVSEPLSQRIRSKFNIPSVVVHNMVGSEFNYLEAQTSKKFTFVSVGSLFPNKNHTLLISALIKLNLPKDTWQLIIVGEGKERNKLQRQINESGLSENIHLPGVKNKQEIARLLNESHVFVLPSISENFSVAVLEALACGMPVVASICGGIRECINEKNGLLFEVNDINGLAKCLKHMYEHYSDYDRQAISDDCKARFSPEVIAKQLETIFKATIEKRHV